MSRATKTHNLKHQVVIVGASVAGVRAATLLAKDASYDITLIHDSTNFEFLSSLLRSGGGRSYRHIKVPLKTVFKPRHLKHIHLVRATISSINPNKQHIVTDKKTHYVYDSLILALESQPRLVPSTHTKHVFNAYSPDDMNGLRRKLIIDFESGTPPKKYAVIGGGETGVEMAAELQQLIKRLARIYDVDIGHLQVVLLESTDRLLHEDTSDVSMRCSKRLASLGVRVALGKQVVSLDASGAHLAGNQLFPAEVLMVSAGTLSNSFYARNQGHFLLSRDGFVRCNDLLEAEGYSNIYVIGNNRDRDSERDMGEAMYDANYVTSIMNNKRSGKNLPHYLPPVHFYSVSIGRWWAAYISKKSRYGKWGWLIKRWNELKHFATLLPKRQALSVWLVGSKHDDIT